MSSLVVSAALLSCASLHRLDEEEQKMQAPVSLSNQASEPDHTVELVDWTDLCSSICNQLVQIQLNAFNAEAVASNLVEANPEILTFLTKFSPKEINHYILISAPPAPPFPVKKILDVVKEIYIISLHNGQFYQIVCSLEGEIDSYLYMTSKEHLAELIQSATESCAKNPGIDLEQIEKLKGKLGEMRGEISEIMSLSCFHDADHAEQIKIILETINFPKCRKSFRRLGQNLQIAQNELKKLASLNSLMYKKHADLTALAKSLYSKEAEGELSEEKELFLNGYFSLFWKTGEKIIRDAFQETFLLARKNHKFILPKALKKAIYPINRMNPEWKMYTLTFLLHHTEMVTDSAYMGTLFSEFGGEDPEGLMRKYLLAMPDEWFTTLKKELKELKDAKLQEKKLESSFLHDFGQKNLTLLSLKAWCETHTMH